MKLNGLLMILTLGLLFTLPACAVEVEGDAAGECSDGVDNDQDGDIDCADDGCAAATACAGDDDDSAGDDDDSAGDDDDTGPDDDDTADDDDGPCVAVSGSGLDPWFAVDMTGTEFDEYEGQRARVVVVLNVEVSRFGIADTNIVGGQFAVSLPETRSAAYTEVAVYIDANGNDRCDDDEPMWSYTTPGAPGDILLEITPSAPEPLFVTEGCLMNGWFDLSVEIPCPG